jgi:hypothetical protein
MVLVGFEEEVFDFGVRVLIRVQLLGHLVIGLFYVLEGGSTGDA